MEAGTLTAVAALTAALLTSVATMAGARWADKRKERATPFDLLLQQNRQLILTNTTLSYALRVLVPPLLLYVDGGCVSAKPDTTDLRRILREGESPEPKN